MFRGMTVIGNIRQHGEAVAKVFKMAEYAAGLNAKNQQQYAQPGISTPCHSRLDAPVTAVVDAPSASNAEIANFGLSERVEHTQRDELNTQP
jgi:hypothetical protein